MPQCRECLRVLSPIDAWSCGQCEGALCEDCCSVHISHCNVRELSSYEAFQRASRRNRLMLWIEKWKLAVTEWWHGWKNKRRP